MRAVVLFDASSHAPCVEPVMSWGCCGTTDAVVPWLSVLLFGLAGGKKASPSRRAWMPSLEGACQGSLYSSQWSFLLSHCTREHDTHHDVVNAQAP